MQIICFLCPLPKRPNFNILGLFQMSCYCRAKLARLQHDISMSWFQTSNLIHTKTVEWNGCCQKQNTKIKKQFSKLVNIF